MQSFEDFYKSLVLEMARPNTVIPNIIGDALFHRYIRLLNQVTKCLKYGVDVNGKPLYDKNGIEAVGLDDSVIQDRKLRYFLFILNGFYHTLDVKDPNLELNFKKAIVNSHDHFIYILKLNNQWKNSTTTKLTTAVALSIKENEKFFTSQDFQDALLNPTILSNYLNIFRVKNGFTSEKAATQREKQFGTDVHTIDNIMSKTRDMRKRENLDIRDAKRRKVNL